MPTPVEEMRIVAKHLQPLEVPFAFVGGAVMCLLVDHPELTQFRPTKDVDVVVEVATYGKFAALEERLRQTGFKHDTSEGAPICRWIVGGCRVDIMSQDSTVHGMNTKWFPEVLNFAQKINLGDGCTAMVVTPPLFLATKLEAFKDRGKGDFYMSHDLEDIVTLVDGCANIVEEVAGLQANIREFIACEFAAILKHPDFSETLPGHLPAIEGAKERVQLVMQRFQAIAASQ